MPNPIYRIGHGINHPLFTEAVQTRIAKQALELPLDASTDDYGKVFGYLVGGAESMISFLHTEIPLDCANYDELDECEQMRVRENLVVLSSQIDGRELSPLSSTRLKAKLELHHQPPRVLIYELKS